MPIERPPPDRVPTLTEVLELRSPAPPGSSATESAAPAPAAAREDDIAALVLEDVLEHADRLLEARLREALAPALARAADVLIREARDELSRAMRQLVMDALARELARRRDR
jgi:hypothetical protein